MVRMLIVVFMMAGVVAFAPVASAQDGALDCEDFTSQALAQVVFNVDPYNDPYGLDGPVGPEFAGVQYLACEELPPPTAAPFSPAPSEMEPPSPSASTSPHVGLPDTGATDGMIGLVLVLGVALVGAGVLLQRRLVEQLADWNG